MFSTSVRAVPTLMLTDRHKVDTDQSLLRPPVYKSEPDPKEEARVTRRMLEVALSALNQVSPRLEFVVFPSGTKVSRLHFDVGPIRSEKCILKATEGIWHSYPRRHL